VSATLVLQKAVHDFSGLQTGDFDVLISDLNHQKLETELSDILGVPYLSRASEEDVKKVVEVGEAIVVGPSFRTIFPCVVEVGGKALWIFFLVDTGSTMPFFINSSESSYQQLYCLVANLGLDK
jgi:hypothetical protein